MKNFIKGGILIVAGLACTPASFILAHSCESAMLGAGIAVFGMAATVVLEMAGIKLANEE